MKKHFLKSLLLCMAAFAMLTAGAAAPDGYYSNLEGLCGANLKKAVKTAAKKNHRAISYGTETWKVFLESDTRLVNGVRCWWDMYSANNVKAPDYNTHGSMNIEHSVANSWWGGTKNDAYKDLFHLNPSDADANNRKANYPLGTVKSVTWTNDGNITTVGKPDSGIGGGSSYVYEPADEYKGDFARVFFYMFTVYNDISWKSNTDWMYDTSSELTLKPWAYNMLLEWAEKDPVSQKEIDRNEAIARHQGNRNPFIDCPELARHIWGDLQNVPFSFDGVYEPDPEPEPDPNPGIDPQPGEIFELMEDFSIAGTGFPEGAVNRPASEKSFTSSKTGIKYAIMGCYQNTYEKPNYLLINGKNNAGAYISFTLDSTCSEIVLTTTGTCSLNANSAVNVYADGQKIATCKVNAYFTDYPVEIPEQYQKAGTTYKIESATSSYNQQFSSFRYKCFKENSTNAAPVLSADDGEEPVSIFTLNGILVKQDTSIDAVRDLAPGCYIVVSPRRTVKILKQ